MKNTKLKGNLLLLLTSVVWGISFIAQSKGVEEITPLAFNGIRCMLGSVVLLPVIAVLDAGKKKKGIAVFKPNKTLIIGGIICGLLLCTASTLQTAGMVYTSPGKSGFITALYMVIVPIIGLFTGKRIRPVIAISVLIAVSGLYLMCIDSELTINKGDILTLICAFIFAGHILAIDYFSPKVDGVKLACLQFFVSGLVNIICMLIFEEPQIAPILKCWASIGYSGIMSCGVAYTLQIVGQKYTDPTSASILMSLESVFATLTTVILIACGWQLTGGALNMREITGCILMFVAIILVQLPEKNKPQNISSSVSN
ncbi:MAG: DMT family transporter [Clostridia bacterium]|nr:DMT family transporter [Clostridia bacterium]